jgi:hypothetical protein
VEELEKRELLSTYYLSPLGNDRNPGTSPDAPWQTLGRANLASFQPGDSILLQGGATFDGSLILGTQDVGTPGAPLRVGSYGTGRATINAGTQSGIVVYDTQNIAITNLNIVGSGFQTNWGNGITFYNDLGAMLSNFQVDQVDASGFGAPDGSLLWGWGVAVAGTFNGSDFQNISITNTAAHDNGQGGISLETPLAPDVYVRNVYLNQVQAYHNAGVSNTSMGTGFGILLSNVQGGTVDHSTAYANGWLPTSIGGGGGIGAIDCDSVVIQNSESYGNLAPGVMNDGDGFFLDSTNHSVLQNDYSHDNDGAGFLLGPIDGWHQAHDNVIRFSTSVNDGRSGGYGALDFTGTAANTSGNEAYGNTLVVGPAVGGVPAAIFVEATGNVHDNLVQTTGDVPVVAVASPGPDTITQDNGPTADTSGTGSLPASAVPYTQSGNPALAATAAMASESQPLTTTAAATGMQGLRNQLLAAFHAISSQAKQKLRIDLQHVQGFIQGLATSARSVQQAITAPLPTPPPAVPPADVPAAAPVAPVAAPAPVGQPTPPAAAIKSLPVLLVNALATAPAAGSGSVLVVVPAAAPVVTPTRPVSPPDTRAEVRQLSASALPAKLLAALVSSPARGLAQVEATLLADLANAGVLLGRLPVRSDTSSGQQRSRVVDHQALVAVLDRLGGGQNELLAAGALPVLDRALLMEVLLADPSAWLTRAVPVSTRESQLAALLAR